MFDNLSEKLSGILDRLTRRGALSRGRTSMRRCARSAARCWRPTSRSTWRAPSPTRCKKRAVGVEVIKSVTPGQMVVKIVHDQLVDDARRRARSRSISTPPPPVPIMMVGLQGSGKTTTTAKLAKRLTERDKRKVLMASLDTRRPAAMEQLAVLGQQVDVETLPIVAGQTPVQIAQPRAAGRPARRL